MEITHIAQPASMMYSMINMHTKRLTITLPDYLYKRLTTLIKPGEVSQFVAEAIESSLLTKHLDSHRNPVEEFLALRGKTEKISTGEILEAIRKGRNRL